MRRVGGAAVEAAHLGEVRDHDPAAVAQRRAAAAAAGVAKAAGVAAVRRHLRLLAHVVRADALLLGRLAGLLVADLRLELRLVDVLALRVLKPPQRDGAGPVGPGRRPGAKGAVGVHIAVLRPLRRHVHVLPRRGPLLLLLHVQRRPHATTTTTTHRLLLLLLERRRRLLVHGRLLLLLLRLEWRRRRVVKG